LRRAPFTLASTLARNDVAVTEGIDRMAAATTPTAVGPSLAREHAPRDVMPRDAEAGLMAALLQKEPEPAETLYARYASRIYGLSLVLLKNEADAEDLTQDTFLKIWRTGSAFDAQRGSLDVWILRRLAVSRSTSFVAELWKLGSSRPSRAVLKRRTSRAPSGMRSSAT
jgi:Sigma-70 region 2